MSSNLHSYIENFIEEGIPFSYFTFSRSVVIMSYYNYIYIENIIMKKREGIR